jgi:hypothetical protein
LLVVLQTATQQQHSSRVHATQHVLMLWSLKTGGRNTLAQCTVAKHCMLMTLMYAAAAQEWF